MKNKYTKEELRKMYDASYAQSLNEMDTERISRLQKFFDLNSSDVVADFACGNGFLMELIHAKIKYYYGVDFSSEQLHYANKTLKEKKINNAAFVCSDIIEFCDGKQNAFDKAFALDFTEHIYDDDLIQIFSSVKKSLKENGKLYIHTPNGNYFMEVLKNKGILKQIPEHIGVRNANEYIDLFVNKIGFKDVSVNYIAHYERFLRRFHFLSFLPLVGKYFEARLLLVCHK